MNSSISKNQTNWPNKTLSMLKKGYISVQVYNGLVKVLKTVEIFTQSIVNVNNQI